MYKTAEVGWSSVAHLIAGARQIDVPFSQADVYPRPRSIVVPEPFGKSGGKWFMIYRTLFPFNNKPF
jgi:hypothetical protein